MKKIYCLAALLLCLLFAGCGKEETAQYFEIKSEETAFYDVAAANDGLNSYFLNMQFYQDEPVQIWALPKSSGVLDVYLYKMDGSRTLLLKDMSDEYSRGSGYIDPDGNYYYWATNKNIIKVDSSGKQLFSRKLSESNAFDVVKICQLEDGKVYVVYMESSAGGLDTLGALDSATGKISKISNNVSSLSATTYIGAGQDGLLYLKEAGAQRINADDGTWTEVWSFNGTTYALGLSPTYPVWDFRIQKDGSMALLQADKNGARGILKTLRKEPMGEGKELVVMRGASFTNNKWLKECVSLFNQENDTWCVVLEDCGTDLDLQEEYARQTSIEIAAGKGPDILYGDVLQDYAYGVFQKEGFAELNPYLENSGIRDDDFFPWIFGCWRSGEKIYSVSPSARFFLRGYGSTLMDTSTLGQTSEPDIKTLTDALLGWQEDAIFLEYTDSPEILELFLKGTENLWEMIDWEAGTCDFDTELFAGILEAAKRYGSDGRSNGYALAEQEYYQLYQYLDKTMLEESGKVRVGTLFDDGCHAAICNERTVAINANSNQKEGAWEFIMFLLEEGQPTEYDSSRYPASRKVFDAIMEKELAKGLYTDPTEYIKGNGLFPLTEQRIKELEEILENARFIPSRTQPILNIIYEEAQEYFSGIKSREEIIAIINNRVKIYLDENHL